MAKPGPEPLYTERLQLRIAKRQWMQLQALAFALDVPVSAVVRQAIDDAFARLEGDAHDEEAG